jgi:hypothetical protein
MRLKLMILAAAAAPLLHFTFFPAAGREMTYQSSFSDTTTMELLDARGRVLETKPVSGGNDSRWREKTLATKDGRRVSFVRRYEKYSDLTGVTLRFDRARPDAPWVARALNGAAVKQERLDGEAESENGSPFAQDEAMLPKRAVAVGDTWPVDPKPILDSWNLGTLGNVRGTASLVSLEAREGHQIATIAIDIDARLTGTESGAFDAPVPLRGTLRYEACVDGTSTEYHSRLDVSYAGARETLDDGRVVRRSAKFSRREDQQDARQP